MPVVLIVPTVRFPPITPFTNQKTPELLLLTVAENCVVVFVGTEAVVGEMETVEEGLVGVLDFFPPPQATRRDDNTRINNSSRDFIILGLLRSQISCARNGAAHAKSSPAEN